MTFGHLAGADTHEARLENQRRLKMAVPSPFTAVAPSRQSMTKIHIALRNNITTPYL